MTRLVRRAAVSVSLLAAAAAASVAFASPASASTTLENEVTKLVNAKRAAVGCAPVRTEEKLRTAGRAHSTDMVTRNFFSHTGSDGSTFVLRANRASYSNAMSENIAWGYRTASSLVTAWMNSPGHKANMLNCSAKAVGIGLAKKADGTPYWTQVFGRV